MYQTLHRTEQRKHDAASTKKICEERAILHITAGTMVVFVRERAPIPERIWLRSCVSGDEILKNILPSGKHGYDCEQKNIR
ncbi:tRNA pseudouridine synthase [Trichinella pseudospiralis]